MKKKSSKLKLIKVGKHLINPMHVKRISEVKKGLYIVKFADHEESFPCWADADDIGALIKEFEIVE